MRTTPVKLNRPLHEQALLDLAPRGTGFTTISCKPDSIAMVVEDGADRFAAPDGLRSRFLYRLKEEQQRANHLGVAPDIFLVERTITWRQHNTDLDYAERLAPLVLVPASFDIDRHEIIVHRERRFENTFFVRHAASLGAVVDAEGHVSVDRDRVLGTVDHNIRAIILVPQGPFAALRLVDPKENPEFFAVPSVRFLLKSDPVIPVQTAIPVAPRATGRLPLDADQARALATALSGQNALIHGPPGCGKTEVIVEAVRSVLSAGKRVLVTSSVPSALQAIRERLQSEAEYAGDCGLAIGEPGEITTLCPPGAPRFDLCIVDEGTRMLTSEGLLVATRSDRLAVFGDENQLPPNGGASDLFRHVKELGAPAVRLTQHYRSRRWGVAWWSNMAVYDRKLQLAPGTEVADDDGVALHVVMRPETSRLEAGWSNPTEARLIAARLLRLVDERCDASIGVVALSKAQETTLRTEVERAFATAGKDVKLLDKVTTSGRAEPFFIRGGNVMGLERDIIIVSATFSPQASGLVDVGNLDRAFPLARLNVALTRARLRTELVTSFTVEDLLRSPKVGPATTVLASVLTTFNAIAFGDMRLPVGQPVELLLRDWRPSGLRIDNLGLVHGLAMPGKPRYALGVLWRHPALTPAEWTTTEAQLRVQGWKLFVVDHSEIADKHERQNVVERLKTALRQAA